IYWLPTEDAIYVHTVDFFDDFAGVGPVMTAYRAASTEVEMSTTQMMFFRNMAMPSFILQPAAGSGYLPGPDQKDELTQFMRRMYQGSVNVNRTAVLPTRWEPVRFQSEFDKIGMPALSDHARDAVLRA